MTRVSRKQVDVMLRGHSVDVEYDSWQREHLEAAKKRLYGISGTAEDKDVYPDIIVHDRPDSSAEHNLLAVEVKKEEEKDHGYDREKLRLFLRHPFLYQHAAFALIPKDGGQPQVEWIKPTMRRAPQAPPVRLVDPPEGDSSAPRPLPDSRPVSES